ncbi:NACHT domain-containing protein [Amycolatopsis sp. NPDC051071]|uniref:NACHT domain-containing protein n=1 Tax=Amycolatopsis sp. NPDC051071 TaxID=3154637 RepID=UPI00342E2051
MAKDSVHNHVSGAVAGNVVQARHIGVVNVGGRDVAAFNVDDYLHAVRRAAEDHPVVSRAGLSAETVPLSAVYVDQDLINRLSGRPATWQGALAANDHMIIVGSPGGGKSSLLRRVAGTLATRQYGEASPACVPVPIHARMFRSGIPLAEAIRDGVVAALGSFLLTNPASDTFAKAAPDGRPWLILVDGLDEVAGVDESRAALEAITEGVRHPFLRFVVATRPIQEADLRAVRNTFPIYELRPFDIPTLGRFARGWLERRGITNALEVSANVVAHVRRNDFLDWLVQPLAATMLCDLLVRDSGQRLPERLSDLYEQYVRKLFVGRAYANAERKTNRDIIQLLERVASERQFRDPERSVLQVAIDFVRNTRLESTAVDPDVRARELHDVLCRTGLVVSADGDVKFAHATFEEYLAARYVAGRLTGQSAKDQWHTVDRVFDSLAASYGMDYYESGISQAFRYSQIPVFLVDMWSTRGKDADALLEHMVRYAPECSGWLVDRLRAAGVSVGTKATAALAAVTEHAEMDQDNRWGAAITLRNLGHPEGIDRLLAMSFDVDLPDSMRIRTIVSCRGSGSAASAAICFLSSRSDFPEWEYPYSAIDAAEALPVVEDEEMPAGLALVLGNRYLPDEVRLHAGCVAVVLEGDGAYRRLVEQRFRDGLCASLGDEAARGVSEAWSVLWRMVDDPDLSGERRWDAADELAVLDDDDGAAAFRALASDLELDDDHRNRAAQMVADLLR